MGAVISSILIIAVIIVAAVYVVPYLEQKKQSSNQESEERSVYGYEYEDGGGNGGSRYQFDYSPSYKEVNNQVNRYPSSQHRRPQPYYPPRPRPTSRPSPAPRPMVGGCHGTQYGCCSDGVTPKGGPGFLC